MTSRMERVREMLLMGYNHLGKIRAYASLSMSTGHWNTSNKQLMQLIDKYSTTCSTEKKTIYRTGRGRVGNKKQISKSCSEER
jgi:hypothetical protein